MKRRIFLGAAVGALHTPFLPSTQAQQLDRPVIGYLSFSEGIANASWRLVGFRRGLAAEGFAEGRDVTVELRSAEGNPELLTAMAADLVQRRVSVILASQTPAALAAKRATQSIPIVFVAASDPVEIGLVSSFNRVGGNATGLYFQAAELVPKRLALLQELLPNLKRIAVLVNAANVRGAEPTVRDALTASRALGLDVEVHKVSTAAEIGVALAAMKRNKADAVLVAADGFFASQRALLAEHSLRHALPSSFALRLYAEAGGFTSYGPDVVDSYRHAGNYVGRILKGARPADLPVQQPTRFELVINLKTAKVLGIEVPPMLLARADEVIE